MTPTPQVSNEQAASRVSIVARLVPAFSYAIPMLGAVLSSLLITRALEAMRNAESAGVAAVAEGLAEANLPTLIAIYLAIFVGVIGIVVMIIRSLMSTTTASPSGWFFLIAGGLSLIPLAFVWQAESLLVQAISPGSGGVVRVVSTLRLCLTLTLITAGTFALILLVASLAPLPSALRARRNYAPIVILVLMELALIAVAIAFQFRTSWFHQVKFAERILP